jgi:hypothetical protein
MVFNPTQAQDLSMTHRDFFARTALLASMFVAPAVLAQGVAVPPTAVPAQAKADKPAVDPRIDPQAIVCKREDATGTRLGAVKVCHTRAQWAAQSMDSRQQAEHMQNGARVF